MSTQSAQMQEASQSHSHKHDDSFMNGSILLIMAAAFFYMSGTMMGTTLIVGYSHTLGASGEFAGIIAGTMNIISLFCRPWAGRFSDHAPLKRFAMIAIVLLIAAYAGYAWSANAAFLFAARLINGIGFSCLSVCLAAWLTALIPLAHIGKGMGYYGMVNALAMALGPAAGIRMKAVFGYRAAFAISTAAMIVAFILVAFVRDGGCTSRASNRAGRTPQTATTTAEQTNTGIRAFISQTISVRVIPVAFVFMLFAIPYCATQSYIVTYVQARNLPVDVSLFFPLYAAALLLLRVLMRNLFDRCPFRWFLWLCSACMLISLGALAFMRNDGVLLIGAIFMAASYGIMSSVSQSDAVRLAGAGHGGRGNGTYYIGLDLGMALGPIIGGWLYANLNIAWFYPALMITMPLAIGSYFVMSRAPHMR